MNKISITTIALLLQILSTNVLAGDFVDPFATPNQNNADPFEDLDRKYEEGLAAFNNQNWILAYEKFKPVADLEYPPAQYFVATMYMNGWGVTKNLKKAAKLLHSSARELPMAEFLYGAIHLVGHGVEKNELIAERYIRSAAEKGVLEAMDHIGNFYKEGTFYPTNYVEACIWYEAAANLGYIDASGKCSKLIDEKQFTKSQVTTVIETAKKKAVAIRNQK